MVANNRHHYRDEIKVCWQLNIVHYDLRLPADRRPSNHKIDRLIAILKTTPRPILIHCKAGADRTGLAAALWKVIVDKEPKPCAKKQLSIRFGHIPFGPTTAMDKFFAEWQDEKIRAYIRPPMQTAARRSWCNGVWKPLYRA